MWTVTVSQPLGPTTLIVVVNNFVHVSCVRSLSLGNEWLERVFLIVEKVCSVAKYCAEAWYPDDAVSQGVLFVRKHFVWNGHIGRINSILNTKANGSMLMMVVDIALIAGKQSRLFKWMKAAHPRTHYDIGPS